MMWVLLLKSIVPILFTLGLGWFTGKYIKESIQVRCTQSIGVLVWLLLVAIGMEFGAVLLTPDVGLYLVKTALFYALILSLVTFTLVRLCVDEDKHTQKTLNSLKDIIPPIKACGLAIFMVLFGIALYGMLPTSYIPTKLSSYLLYILIFFIAIDLSRVQLGRLTWQHILVPVLTIIAWFISAVISSFILDKSIITLLMVSGGFGWFSLSAPLITQLTDANLGSLALLVDLLRELFSIMLLYLFGRQYPKSIIAVCGATAMDSTLPFVKKNCSHIDVQIALFSGFMMTILAPFIIVFFVYIGT